jgi:hypothetical protein
MTISRSRVPGGGPASFGRVAAALGKFAFTLGLAGIATSLAIEFRFGRPPFDHPSAFRTHMITAHGFQMWVSGPIWLAHDVGLYLFFAFWAVAAALILIDHCTSYLRSQH